MHVRYSRQQWVNNIRDFTNGYAFKFFKYFFTFHIDIVIVLDCINRYILICHPDHVDKIMSWNVLVGIQGGTLLVTGTFSFLTAKMEKDLWKDDFLKITDLSSTWAYNIALKIIVHSLSSLFFIFFTVKICAALKKAAAFLRQSSSTEAHAKKYDRIITFSKAICITVVVYNLLLENAMSGIMISDFTKRYNVFVEVDYYYWQSEDRVRIILERSLFSKFGFYALVYIWLKLKQK